MISVATYRRPELLRDLLTSIQAAVLPGVVRVCVVDNDPSGSAAPVIDEFHLPISYVREPRPGIAAARNRALDELTEDDDFIVFVDDDERVTPNWLTHLLATQKEYGATVVSGPVVSVFPPEASRWIIRGGFIQRARFVTGSSTRSPATNNTLVDLKWLRAAKMPRFDESFSMTGGSDTAFFRGLRDLGAVMVWNDDAEVYEDVPPSRATFRWIWRRGVREGNVSGRLHLRTQSRIQLATAGLARIGYGAARQAALLLMGRGPDAKSVAYMTRGIGWIGASTNRLVVEYARDTAPTSTSQGEP